MVFLGVRLHSPIAECGKFTLALLSTVQLVEFMTDFNPDDCPHLSRQYGSQ